MDEREQNNELTYEAGHSVATCELHNETHTNRSAHVKGEGEEDGRVGEEGAAMDGRRIIRIRKRRVDDGVLEGGRRSRSRSPSKEQGQICLTTRAARAVARFRERAMKPGQSVVRYQ